MINISSELNKLCPFPNNGINSNNNNKTSKKFKPILMFENGNQQNVD